VRSIEREAVRLAQEHGPAALTVDQICAAVGITQRSFFNHFDTKDDALLGWDLPRLSEQRVREYLADPTVGVLTGALGLVEAPAELTEDPELARARLRVLSGAPWLAVRQAARIVPLAGQVQEVVERKLRSIARPELDEVAIRESATTITAIAASLTLRLPLRADPLAAPGSPAGMPLPDPVAAASGLDGLRWIWDRLI
jgi:AcrR family transcriptional regulator